MGENIHKFVPVLLSDVDFSRNDLMGIEPQQIFRLEHDSLNHPRSFVRCKKDRADDFAQKVYEFIYDKSMRLL
jgi:hypothetical protein